jgi:hypothetical protein
VEILSQNGEYSDVLSTPRYTSVKEKKTKPIFQKRHVLSSGGYSPLPTFWKIVNYRQNVEYCGLHVGIHGETNVGHTFGIIQIGCLVRQLLGSDREN